MKRYKEVREPKEKIPKNPDDLKKVVSKDCTIFIRIYKQHMLQCFRQNQMSSFIHKNKPLIIDFEFLNKLENVKHIRGVIRDFKNLNVSNRSLLTPFPIHVINYREDHLYSEKINKYIQDLDSHMITFHKEDLLPTFPKKDLVYISLKSGKKLTKFDPDKIYILPAISEEHFHQSIVLGKAKRIGIETMRFPIEK